MPTPADYAITALTLWRENRGGNVAGMTSVACVIRNRVAVNKSSFYAECVKPWQFSSMTAHGDPQLGLFPKHDDPEWVQAQGIAKTVIDDNPADITHGATFYYALTMTTPPKWAATLTKTCVIEGQAFYR